MGFDLSVGISAVTVFLQGLLSVFSPCVLPLIPLYIGYLAGGTAAVQPDGTIRYPRRRVLVNTLFFVLGISFAFFLLGMGFTALGRFFSGNRTLFTRCSGVLILVFGLYQLGIFGRSSAMDSEHRFHLPLNRLAMNPLTALLLGFTFSFAWTPCVGPTLGSVLLMVVVHPLLSKPSVAIPTLVLIWLDVIFGGLFLADLIVSAIQAVGFSKQLARIDELRKAMRTTSDALTEVIGTSAMTMDTLLDEQKLQLTLAAMEGATNAAELRDQLRELAGKAGTLRDTTIRLSKQRFFGTGRLLRAFPDMVPDRREALASLRVGLTKATARAKAAAKQAVKTGKNAMKKEDK